MNVENYPQSSNAFDSLAEAYLVKGDEKKAKEYYEIALQLDPENGNSRNALEKLKSND